MMLSVIVPIYNAEKYLSRCIDSILGQTFTDFELLLVNDGSTDKSGAICNAYAHKDSRIRVFHQANSGVSSARNTGIANAHTAWITFCDSDDYVEPDWLTNFIKICNGYDLVVQGFCSEKCAFKLQTGINYSGAVQEGLLLLIDHAMAGYVWNKLFRLDVIQKYQISFDERYQFREDEDFVLKYMSVIRKIVCTPQESYHYVVPDWNNKYKQLDNFYVACSMFLSVKRIYVGRSFNAVCQKYLDELNNALFYAFEAHKPDRRQRLAFYQQVVGKSVIKSQISRFSKYLLYAIHSPSIVSWVFDFKTKVAVI